MNARARQLLDELLLVPAEERALIASELDGEAENARPEEIENAWAEEIERRVANVVEGRSTARTVADALAELRARLQTSRVQR